MATKKKRKPLGRRRANPTCTCPELIYVIAPGVPLRCPVHGEDWLPADVARTIRDVENGTRVK